jgi:Abnormal spindle-like microcephaly-assoc'd, ASPM-SPD-2-Hydin
MARQSVEAFRFSVHWFRAIQMAFGGVLMIAASSHAGVLTASWTASTTNTDGSPATSLVLYRLYYSTFPSPCPGATFVEVAAPTSPPTNHTVSYQLTGLSTGSTYSVSITAVNSDGTESACSVEARAVARTEFAITPIGTVSFGNVAIGGSATRTFTMQSTGSGTITGAVSVRPPFSVDSGSPFILVGSGATATVTVRFAPTSAVSASTTMSFTANGDMQSRLVTGTGMNASATTPTLSPGTSPPRQASREVEHPTPASEPVNTFDAKRKGQRRELRESPRTSATAGPSNDTDDPRAVIDWLLMRRPR